ncbi:MAG: hypothetical protein PGN09_03565 [Sphingomonas fennica]
MLDLLAVAAAITVAPPSSAAAAEMAAARDLLHGGGAAGPTLTIPRGRGAANLCFASAAAKALYPGAGVEAVTRDNPFMPYPEANGGPCAIRVFATPIAAPAPAKAAYRSCTIGFRTEGGRQVIDIAPNAGVPVTRFVLGECFYRMALALEGYRGALDMPTERLFVSTDRGFWAGQARFVGPIASFLPIRLTRLCPTLPAAYYRADFADWAARSCIPAPPEPAARRE